MVEYNAAGLEPSQSAPSVFGRPSAGLHLQSPPYPAAIAIGIDARNHTGRFLSPGTLSIATMPVFHKHKLIHIHIPKTGGTAIEGFFHSIGDMTWGRESWVGQEKKNGRWYEYQHLSMPELHSLAGSVFSDHSSFAVVRDPYTRLISDYTWRRLIQQRYPESPTQFFDTFDSFLKAIPKDIDACWTDHIHNADQKRANFLIHVRPQHQYVLDEKGNCLVDDILEYERLDEALSDVLARYGLHADRIKTPPKRDIDGYFSRAQINRVHEIYAADFELFSFSRI